uniref:NADH-ubiquinone oxidoreductase chain 4L n=1 Tax=Isotomurus maculatus TaxID=36143 RepID=A0A5P9W7J2_9HEXA|nr:NADH dehydrogenase subunit 4L [Isotomurus maculatus]
MFVFVMLFFVFSGLWIFCSKREHLLSVLMSLEFMVLSVFILFYVVLGGASLYYSLIYLTFSACEGALGLSILVVMSRTHGGDYFKSFGLTY